MRLIAKDSDKDDPIDAERLAQLLRGGYLKEVHQAQSLDRTVLKQHVSFYHDRVRERVRQGINWWPNSGGMVSSPRSPTWSIQTSGARLWKQLPPRKVLRNDLDLVLAGVRAAGRAGRCSSRAELIRLPAARSRFAVSRNCPAWAGSVPHLLRVHRHAVAIRQQVGPVAVLRHRPGTAAQRQRTA